MLKDSLHETALVVSDTTAKVISITAITERISDEARFLSRKVKLIQEDILFIKKVAVQTKLLGLNARIEAVREGETGWEFAVIANEVQKLADMVAEKESAVEKNIKEVEAVTFHNAEEMIALSEDIQQIAANMQEMEATIEELATVAHGGR